CLSIHPRYCPWSPRCVFVGAEWGAVVVGLCPCDPGILVRPPWRFCISSGRSSPDHGYWGNDWRPPPADEHGFSYWLGLCGEGRMGREYRGISASPRPCARSL